MLGNWPRSLTHAPRHIASALRQLSWEENHDTARLGDLPSCAHFDITIILGFGACGMALRGLRHLLVAGPTVSLSVSGICSTLGVFDWFSHAHSVRERVGVPELAETSRATHSRVLKKSHTSVLWTPASASALVDPL